MHTSVMDIDNSPPINISSYSPSEYADKLGWTYASSRSSEFRKKYGQYMTPVAVARFMAQLFDSKSDDITILDPGAGTGVLNCAILENLANSNNHPQKIKLVVYEIDTEIIPYLEKALEYSKKWLKRKNVSFTYRIVPKDFILANSESFNSDGTLSLFEDNLEKFDYIISNPPYFKLSKSDPRAKIASKIVYGQPNIYAIFMSISALLLNEGGELVFITPRSYAAGPYFKAFRKHFFSLVQPVYIHLFGSRKDAFDRDAILQENIILKAVKDHTFEKPNAKVTISFSQGVKDLNITVKRDVPVRDIVDLESKNKVLRIPVTSKEDHVVELVHSWGKNLHSLGLNISTGPVVAFRASRYLSNVDDNNGFRYAPLLWMQNIKAMSVRWPVNCNKKQFIEDSQKTQRLLIPNKNYVLLRRFSAKEENRRLVAAPYLSGLIKSETVGLENHLNYIYRPKGNLSLEEAVGLAALLNSELLDTYFRTSNGNTQVSATELKDMPLPSAQTIKELGRHIIRNNIENGQIDEFVLKNLANLQ